MALWCRTDSSTGCTINNTCNNLGPRLLCRAGFSISQPAVGGKYLSCSLRSWDTSLVAMLSIAPVRSWILQLHCGNGAQSACHGEENIWGSREGLLCSLRADFVSLSAETYSFPTAPQAPRDTWCQEKTVSRKSLVQPITADFSKVSSFRSMFLTLKGLSEEASLTSFCLSVL